MAIETTKWDIADFLTDGDAIAAYLDAVFADGDPDEMRAALAHVARAKGMGDLAHSAGITRGGLYKALGETGNPSFSTVAALLDAMGVRLAVVPKAA
ncbi:addiction module antidote protein [Blastomonas sp.]|uniref:addiction module antidote protein n=1 Tax=Blastomonas sp. TaxID=1909299 RepID=UPI0026184A2D|nr:addiction module antidote protein [Blastomonas sp.]MDM7957095.1 putative addiction module antidote protein [Blastomonas sp.]